MSTAPNHTARWVAPRAHLWGIGECDVDGRTIDVPITWEEIERDAEWYERVLRSSFGLGRGDVVVVVAGPAEAGWAQPLQMAVTRLGGVYAMAWTTLFDARRVGVHTRTLRARIAIGIDNVVVDGLKALPGGVTAQLGAVEHVLARTDAHLALEEEGIAPLLFDLLGPAAAIELPDRAGARLDPAEWSVSEDAGELVLHTLGERGLRLDAARTGRSGVVLDAAAGGAGTVVTLTPVTRTNHEVV